MHIHAQDYIMLQNMKFSRYYRDCDNYIYAFDPNIMYN